MLHLPLRLIDRPLHVGLAGAEPDLADEDVLEDDLILARDGHRVRLAVGLHRLQRHLPAPVVIGLGADLLAIQRHRDLLARIGPAPDRQLPVPLEHHVTVDYRWQLDVGTSRHRDAQPERGNTGEEQQLSHDGPPSLALGVWLIHCTRIEYDFSRTEVVRARGQHPKSHDFGYVIERRCCITCPPVLIPGVASCSLVRPTAWWMVAAGSAGVTGRALGRSAWRSLSPTTRPPRMPPPARSAL